MTNKIQKIILVLMILFVWLTTYSAMTLLIYQHEFGHQEINRLFGYESEIIMYNFGLAGYTTITNFNCGVIMNENCRALLIAQSNHETIAYTFIPMFFIFITSIALTVTIILIFKIME